MRGYDASRPEAQPSAAVSRSAAFGAAGDKSSRGARAGRRSRPLRIHAVMRSSAPKLLTSHIGLAVSADAS